MRVGVVPGFAKVAVGTEIRQKAPLVFHCHAKVHLQISGLKVAQKPAQHGLEMLDACSPPKKAILNL